MATPYRDDIETILARLASVNDELSRATARREELEALQESDAALEKEIEALRRDLGRLPTSEQLVRRWKRLTHFAVAAAATVLAVIAVLGWESDEGWLHRTLGIGGKPKVTDCVS